MIVKNEGKACVADKEFSMAEARKAIGDLFQPNPVIYWLDFSICFVVAMTLSLVTANSEFLSWQQILSFVVYCCLYYRLAMFIHELVHLRTGSMKNFRFVWNLLVGIPFLIPTFVYYPHRDHHRRKHYGTDKDGEYLPLEHQGRWHILLYLATSLVIPFLAIFRFMVVTPITWFSPTARDFAIRHSSSMVIDPRYIRPLPTKEAMRIFRIQETMCFLWCLSVLVGVFIVGEWPYPLVIQGYCTAVFVLTLNALRTLISHRWANHEGEMTFIEQLLDTINFPKQGWLNQIWAPVGTRFHALHHLFPSLPYHNMPEAHHRLMALLPEGSPYHRTSEASAWSAMRDLWTRAGNHHDQGPTSLDQPEAS